MRYRVTKRFKIETALAVISLLLGGLTLLWRDWIEFAFRVDPDRHSGSVEWFVVGALGFVCLAATLLAGADWKRLHGAGYAGAAGS
jgi:hypothetical protein